MCMDREPTHTEHTAVATQETKNLFQPGTVAELHARLARLTPESPRGWGRMTVGQMVAHCAMVMEDAVGDRRPPRQLIGRIIGPLARGQLMSARPISRNAPTDQALIPTSAHELDAERARLALLIDRFAAGGAAGVTTHPHRFFGRMTPDQWATWMYKHLDHHLRQFGV